MCIRDSYQDVGVSLYWVVDPEAREVEVWTPADTFPIVEREHVTWQPSGASEALEIDLPGLFKPL